MSAEQDQVRQIAERIARRMSERDAESAAQEPTQQNKTGDELAEVRASLAEMKRKLAHLEEHLSNKKDASTSEAQTARMRDERGSSSSKQSQERGAPLAAHSPWLSGMYVPATHPSQETFDVEEAAVSELVDFFEREKICELEPGGKPCNHCAMCNTRGF